MSRRHSHGPTHPPGRAVFFKDMLTYGHRIDRWLADGSVIGLYEREQTGVYEVVRLHPVGRVFSRTVTATNRKSGITAGFPIRMKVFLDSPVSFHIEFLVRPSPANRKYFNAMTKENRAAERILASRHKLLKRQNLLRMFIHTALDTEFVQTEIMPVSMMRLAMPKH